jgi:hypothetical protein
MWVLLSGRDWPIIPGDELLRPAGAPLVFGATSICVSRRAESLSFTVNLQIQDGHWNRRTGRSVSAVGLKRSTASRLGSRSEGGEEKVLSLELARQPPAVVGDLKSVRRDVPKSSCVVSKRSSSSRITYRKFARASPLHVTNW